MYVIENCVMCVLGVLYIALMEKVFSDHIPISCKRKLSSLRPVDVDKIKKGSGAVVSKGDYEAKALVNLQRHYEVQEIVAMSSTLFHNTALVLHKRRKESKSWFL